MKLVAKTTPVSHEDLFIERYQAIRSWALQMTNDHELAEDLVQDAFIQFTFTRPEIAGVHNLQGYLYVLLRNLHMSQLRRAARARLQPLSIVEYESAEMSLRAADARDQIKAQDELRQICQFACARKETAWVGSVLILRFFHGYYPSEIAQILRTSRASVDQRLMLARSEARLSLEHPGRLDFVRAAPASPLGQMGFAREPHEFLLELRQMIFHSRHGRCFSRRQFQTLYKTDEVTQMKNEELAHVVSCPSCLDEVNKTLGLPLLAERYPTDTLGRDQRGKGGKGGDDGGSGASGSSTGAIKRWRRRAREAFEHRPKELHISVNGLLQGSQKVNSELSEQTLDVDMVEQINFVEVFSELGVRLLLLNVDEPPPRGQVEQVTRVEFSDRRTLDLKLRFSSPWPTLQVAYVDPLFGAEAPTSTFNVQRPLAEPVTFEGGGGFAAKRVGSLTGIRKRWLDFGLWTFDVGLLFRPATVTALVALFAIAAFVLTRLHGPARIPSAAELLQQSIQQEEALAARTDQVLHRTINLEERVTEPRAVATGSSGQRISHHKIEIWQSAEKGIVARRLYDEKGYLVAGDWRRSDGVQTLYHHATQQQLQIRNPRSAIRSFDDVWLLDPSARDFNSLITIERAGVEERVDSYRINYDADANAHGLIKASLVLSKADLHATQQTLTVRHGDEVREYHFLEASFERRAPSTVAPKVFEPEPELLTSEAETRGRGDAESSSSPLTLSPLPPAASAALEVEVLRELDKAGAFYGEQLSLTRTPEGQLVVQGVVDSAKRKGEIRQALASFLKNPAVRFAVETAEEAQARQARQARRGESISVSESSVEVEQERATPADADLRAYFSRQGLSGTQLDQEMRRFSDRALAHARQARRHALALKQIVERFSAEDLRTMDAASRQQWRALIDQHARSIRHETESLRRELQPIFFPNASGAGGVSGSGDVAQTAKQLFEIAVSNDDVVRRSFTLGSSGAPAVKSSQFARSLNSAIALAAAITSR